MTFRVTRRAMGVVGGGPGRWVGGYPHNFPIATPCVASHLLFVRGQSRFSLTGPVRMPELLHQTEFFATGGAREGELGLGGLGFGADAVRMAS